MRLLGALAMVLALSACGGGEGERRVDGGSQSPEASSTQTREGESTGCRVAANKWADRMTNHVLDASTTAPAWGQGMNLRDVEDLQSEIEVMCSAAVSKPVADATQKMLMANYELAVCMQAPCNNEQAGEVRRLADQAAGKVGVVRDEIGTGAP